MPPFVLLRFAKKCAKIYYVCKAMVHSSNPLLFHRFCYRCDLYKVPAVVMYKKSNCRHIGVVFTSIFTIQTAKSLKYSKRTKIRLVFSHSGAVNRKNSVRTQKVFGNSHRNIWSNGKRPRKKFNFFLMSLRSYLPSREDMNSIN